VGTFRVWHAVIDHQVRASVTTLVGSSKGRKNSGMLKKGNVGRPESRKNSGMLKTKNCMLFQISCSFQKLESGTR
jgi:hypothetical protein